jgi:unsaturated chondroitin disaccharide hydrolase
MSAIRHAFSQKFINKCNCLGIVFLIVCFFDAKSQAQSDPLIDSAIVFAQGKLLNAIQLINNNVAIYPSETNPTTHKWLISTYKAAVSWWTSGYFPACYWSMYQITGDTIWKNYAKKWTEGLASEQYDAVLPDMAGMIYFGYGNGYKCTQDPSYIPVLDTTALTYCNSFYSPSQGAIRCWGNWSGQNFAVVTDFMIYNEFMFSTFQLTGERRYYDVVTSHIAKTMKYNLRTDGSMWQFVNFNDAGVPVNYVSNGDPYQGMNGGTRWSRGQAWAINGFTQAYRYTRDQIYLDNAKKTADYFITHLPADSVPPCDFDGPEDAQNGRDAAAAAIACSGLLELAGYAQDNKYRQSGINILHSLCRSGYMTNSDTSYSSILKRAKVRYYESEKGLIYADAFFLEAIAKFKGVYKYFMPGKDIIRKINISKTDLTLPVGATSTLTATVLLDSLNRSVNWKTSDSSVASVNSSGLVTANALGSCYITVKSITGGYSDSCHVTVVPRAGVENVLKNVKIQLTVFPNPVTNGYFNITVKQNNKSKPVIVELYDLCGKLEYYSLIKETETGVYPVQLVNCTSGMHVLKMYVNNTVIKKKVFIQN